MAWKPLPKSCKAAEAWDEFIYDRDSTYFLLEGAVRSSKTFGSILAWADWVENIAPPGPLAMLGKTRETLIQNVLYPLTDLVGPQMARLNRGTSTLYLFGRPIYLFGADNIRAATKLQGKGFVGAYCDEAETYPHEVWQMLGTRTDAESFKVLATFNPGPPNHYLKKDYMDRLDKVDGRHWHFVLDDNPFLSEKVKDRLKRQYTGLFYKRYILGLWVAAEGAIYDMFDEGRHIVHDLPQFASIVVGVDYGTVNPTSFIALGYDFKARRWIAFKEYYYDSAARGRQKTDAEYAKDMQEFLKGIHPSNVLVDPSAASFRATLRQQGTHGLTDANNSVLDGIRSVATGLTTGKLMIHESCTHLIEEFPGYVWDTKAQENGEDKPVKQGDHALDALRYGYMRAIEQRIS
jgi:PBSX family phage terminase large subunit